MAGFVICCGFLCIIGTLYMALTFGLYLFGEMHSLLWSIAYSGIYCFSFIFYITLYVQAMTEMHKTALDFLKKKEESKRIYREERLKSNVRAMISLVLKHLLFLAISISAAFYFQIWYIKYPIIIYISSFLGYVACYPLSEESTESLLLHKYTSVENELLGKSVINTSIFLGMIFIYSQYIR